MGAISTNILRLVSNAELVRRETSAAVTSNQSQAQMLGLARHLATRWSAAKRAKVPIETQMLMNLRQRNGIYETSKLQQIRAMGGSEVYMMLTQAKCAAAVALLEDILLPPGDRAWRMKPEPVADLPGEVEQAIVHQVYVEAQAAGMDINDPKLNHQLEFYKHLAEKRMQDLALEIAERMSGIMETQLKEGNWYRQFPEFLYDFVTFKAGILKGPVLRKRKKLQWGRIGNHWVPVVKEIIGPEFERRSPFNIYPAPRSRGPQHSYLFDRYEYTREDLQSLKGVPGYDSDAIDEVLWWYGERGYETPQYRRYELGVLEERPLERLDPEGPIETLNYWGSASGKMLLEWAPASRWEQDIDANAEYQIEAWQIGRYVIKAVLNPDPLGRKPYGKASFEEIPGTFWGKGLPEVLFDCQDMCNGAARALANNLAISSGPQVEINIDRLADGASVTQLYPWKIHQTVTDPTGNNQPAVKFYTPPSVAQELMLVYNHFEGIADKVSRIPNYSYGDSKVGGAGRTASGLSMLLGTASKGIKSLVSNIDINVTEDRLTHLYEWNMEHHPDWTAKGALKVEAQGVRSLMQKEQLQMRRTELLTATANPIDAQIMGMDGRRALLHATVKGADLDADDIVKSKEELQLEAGSTPQPFQMLGAKGPNAPGGGQGEAGPAGMTTGGGTPAAPATLDASGAPVSGQATRQFNQ